MLIRLWSDFYFPANVSFSKAVSGFRFSLFHCVWLRVCVWRGEGWSGWGREWRRWMRVETQGVSLKQVLRIERREGFLHLCVCVWFFSLQNADFYQHHIKTSAQLQPRIFILVTSEITQSVFIPVQLRKWFSLTTNKTLSVSTHDLASCIQCGSVHRILDSNRHVNKTLNMEKPTILKPI